MMNPVTKFRVWLWIVVSIAHVCNLSAGLEWGQYQSVLVRESNQKSPTDDDGVEVLERPNSHMVLEGATSIEALPFQLKQFYTLQQQKEHLHQQQNMEQRPYSGQQRQQNNLIDLMASRSDLSRFQTLVKVANLQSVINLTSTMTVFSPNNQAIDKQGYYDLLQTKGYEMHLLDAVGFYLSDHDPVWTKSLLQNPAVDRMEMVTSGQIRVNRTGTAGQVSLRAQLGDNISAAILVPDLAASNGILHVIDTALLPFFTTQTHTSYLDYFNNQVYPKFTRFLQLVNAAGMINALSARQDFTLLAPNDLAISDATLIYLLDASHRDELVQVLSNHMLPSVVNYQKVSQYSVARVSTDRKRSSLLVRRSGFNNVTFDRQAHMVSVILVRRGIIYEVDRLIIPTRLSRSIP